MVKNAIGRFEHGDAVVMASEFFEDVNRWSVAKGYGKVAIASHLLTRNDSIDNSLITENCNLDISEFAWLDSCGLGGRALAVRRTDVGVLYWNYEKDIGQKYKCFPVVWTY